MDNTPAFDPLDYVSVLRRRVWWLVTPIVLAIIAAAALADAAAAPVPGQRRPSACRCRRVGPAAQRIAEGDR